MKNILLPGLLIVLSSTLLLSCKKDKADVPAPVTDLSALPGRNRAEVQFTAPHNARTGKVFYGNGKFKAFNVINAGDLQEVIVDSLNEQQHKLRIVTISEDGYVSDPISVSVTVYGNQYEAALKPRKWADQITHSANSLEFFFDEAVSEETEVRVVFTNTTGALDSVRLTNSSNAVVVNSIDTSKAYYYYSVYKPVENSIDDFYSQKVDLKTALMLNFKKDGWSISESSGENPGFEAQHLIDNDGLTLWTSSAARPYPHHITIDMAGDKYVDGFYILNHPNHGRAAKSLKFEISQDNLHWTTLLQADVTESYFRQQLVLNKTALGRFVKITVLSTSEASATEASIAEVDMFNVQSTSGDNGFTNMVAVPLVNAKAPFSGDGSNPFPALGEYRMQKLAGWTHSANAVVSYDNNGSAFSLFTAAVWGLPEVQNGKIAQAIDLQPGEYVLTISSGDLSGPSQIYALVSASAALPDFSTLTTAAETLSYTNFTGKKNHSAEMLISVTEARKVHIGFVYNISSQYGATGIPWSFVNFNEVKLVKVS